MDVVYSPEAVEDLKQFSSEARKEIREKIDELREKPTDHEDSKLIQVKGRQVYRLEIKEKRQGEIDHRAIYDVEDGKIRIYSVIYRDPGYRKDEISDRF